MTMKSHMKITIKMKNRNVSQFTFPNHFPNFNRKNHPWSFHVELTKNDFTTEPLKSKKFSPAANPSHREIALPRGRVWRSSAALHWRGPGRGSPGRETSKNRKTTGKHVEKCGKIMETGGKIWMAFEMIDVKFEKKTSEQGEKTMALG